MPSSKTAEKARLLSAVSELLSLNVSTLFQLWPCDEPILVAKLLGDTANSAPLWEIFNIWRLLKELSRTD